MKEMNPERMPALSFDLPVAISKGLQNHELLLLVTIRDDEGLKGPPKKKA